MPGGRACEKSVLKARVKFNGEKLSITEISGQGAAIGLELGSDTVHIWLGFVPRPNDFLPAENLSAEELRRGARFVHEKDRRMFLFSHEMLRRVLACYIKRHPRDMVFNENPFGKPYVVQDKPGKIIQFNMAHSQDLAAVAVCLDRQVGVDVEYMREVVDGQEIVARNFSLTEQVYMRNLPPEDFRDRFFTCWTLKEAFLKAIGKGLSYPLERFSVVDMSGKIHGDEVMVSEPLEDKWYQFRFDPHPGYKAAVVLQGWRPDPRYFNYNTI